MNRQLQPKPYFAATQRVVANADAIEWEELPSLAKRVARRGANDSAFMHTTIAGSSWDNTMPACFDPAPVSQPFAEQLAGLSTREVLEPEVFLHFFGPDTLDR